MRSIIYTIPRKPIAWQRPVTIRYTGAVYDPQVTEKNTIGLYILRDHKNQPMFQGPLHLEATFYLPIPKLNRNRETSIYHSKRPDCDNFLKLVMDSITKTNIVWKDDNQVAKITAQKLYDKNPRTVLIITELE
jgi:Holliday junction resolvase RusA-like endonuclease